MAKPGSQRNPTIESLKDRIARDPFSRAFLQLAEEYRREGRFQEAIEVCLEGLQRHPTYHTARISLGRTYMEAGDMENARRAFSEVLELQPENHLAAKLLAEIQKKMGDVAGAAATYRGILRYYPNDREVATLLQESQRREPPSASAAPVPPLTRVAPAPSRPVAGAAAPPAGASPVSWPGVPAPRPSDPSPDFRPEDLGFTPIAAAGPRNAPAGAVRPPWPGPGGEDVHETADDALQTNTLAELYLRQGLVDRAMEVYRGMLRVDPENRKAARRLSELAQGAVPQPAARGGGSAPVPRPVAAAAPSPEARRAIAEAPGMPAKENGGARQDTIRRLERWLANVGASAAKGAPPR